MCIFDVHIYISRILIVPDAYPRRVTGSKASQTHETEATDRERGTRRLLVPPMVPPLGRWPVL